MLPFRIQRFWLLPPPKIEFSCLTIAAISLIFIADRGAAHMGMVLCTFDRDFLALAQRIHAAVAATHDMRDQVVRVNRLP